MPLEEAVSAISGIDELRAMVTEGSSNVIVTFTLDKDISEAVEEVREKAAGAVRRMPPNVLPPVVRKADPDSDPVVNLALSGDASVRELTEVADKIVRRGSRRWMASPASTSAAAASARSTSCSTSTS